jgi:hypothetical protein
MIFKKTLILASLFLSMSAYAAKDQTSVEVGAYLGGGITESASIRFQSETSAGGYTFLEAKTETYEPYTGSAFAFGMGITDQIDSEMFLTDLYLDAGYIFENITADEDPLLPARDNNIKHRGFIYAIGSETTFKGYPDVGVLFEIKHYGSAQILATDTLIGAGISYVYDDFKIKAKYYTEGWGQLTLSYYY